ncbi:MAG: YaaL family protein [Lactobacillus sp.]
MRKNRIKQQEDARLLATVAKLQAERASDKALDMITLDFSEDNKVAEKILQAKYTFLYNEACYRHARATNIDGVITE